jgi:hypothetical protein
MKRTRLLTDLFAPLVAAVGAAVASFALVGCAATNPTQDPAPADVAVAWNELVMATAVAEDGLLTLKGVRTAAMVHLAMHDALAAVYPRYFPYIFESPRSDADPVAAANQAAFAVAIAQYPDQRDAFEAERSRWTPTMNSVLIEAGVALGEASASAILSERENDGWDTEAAYTWHPMGPGVYAEFNEHSGTPEGFVFGAGWGGARPFMLDRADQFVSPPPPDTNSDEYTAAFEEVKSVGRFDSQTRTADQTHLAMWWKDFIENSHNRLARDLVVRESLDLVDASRLFALVSAGVFDAYVSSFHNKFLYNHWRPYTAIRWAAHDGNPDTDADEDWTNTHQHTYAFPSYPSAHGTACAAAMAGFADTFGDDYSFTMSNPEVDIAGPFSGKMKPDPPVRSFESFSDAALECTMSRVYLGIHFRYDSDAGNALGRKVGDVAVRRLARR